MTDKKEMESKSSILLVDDDLEFRRSVEIILKKNNYDVLPAGGLSSAYKILESNLNDIISPFSEKLSSKLLKLTPTEIRIANLVRQGLTSKEIAGIMSLSVETIGTHRKKIRKKIGLNNKETNLQSYLLSI